MHRKGLVIGILILMLSVNIGSTFAGDADVKTISSVGFDGNTLYVGGSGPNNYTTIQSAIDNASDGDTVFVYNGVYYEHIIIYKQIFLIGEDKVNTVIDGGGNNSILWENIIRIADDNVQINGLTLRNLPGHTDDGLSCENYDNICIENIIIHSCYNGINMLNSENVSISNVIFFNNNHLDIQNYFFSKNHIIQGCYFSDSDSSISFDVENGVIKNCLFSNITAWSIIVSGNNSLVENNSFFEVGQSIRISTGTNITCRNNTIENSQGGISFSSCSGNLVTNNIITNVSQWWGCISLNHATLNYISGNIIMNNDIGPGIGFGILSDSNIIFENCISNCEVGFKIHEEANNNEFFHNNLINNIQNAYDECNNSWDNGYPSCGNYWSDYYGVDNYSGPNQNILGPDGVGDIPYDLPCEYAMDRYPLMEPYGMTKLTMSIKNGLLKFSGIIKNIGNKTAFNVQWKITLEGGFILIGRNSSGYLPRPLLAGEEMSVSSGIVIGFGRIVITVAVWANNAPLVFGTISGFLLLFFIKINPGGGI